MSKFQSKVPAADWDRALEGGLQMSRPNLLDNWYFADPVNQRGETEYTGPGYTIDRWKLPYNKSASVKIECGGLLLTRNGENAILEQKIPLDLTGVKVCISGLTNEGLYSGTKTVDAINYTSPIRIPNVGDIQVFSSDGITTFRIWVTIDEASCKFKAVKLELGDTQTLARQDDSGGWVLNDPPPSKALELLKCQRYFQRYRTESLRPTYAEDCRPVMCTEPTKGTITADGVTYYTLSADL